MKWPLTRSNRGLAALVTPRTIDLVSDRFRGLYGHDRLGAKHVHAVAITNEDQNRLCGLPLHSWRTYHFPTIDSAIRFAIHSAVDSDWECKYDGVSIQRANGETKLVKNLRAQPPKPLRPTGKPLKPLPVKPLPSPKRPALRGVPDGTTWSGNALRTVMADSVVLTWDTCGGCAQFVMNCVCKNGISAPRAVDYIARKTAGYVAGQKWEDVDTTTKKADTGPQTFVQPWREGRPTTTAGTTPAPRGKPLRPVVQPPTAPVGKLLRGSVGKPIGKPLRPEQRVPEEPTIEVTEDFELSSLDDAATAHADSLTKRLTTMTRTLPGKQPSRKTLPGKKLPRKV